MPNYGPTSYVTYTPDRQKVEPTLAPSNVFGMPQSAWDPASYYGGSVQGWSPTQADYQAYRSQQYAPQSMPSLPSLAQSNVDPTDWTAQAFGAQQPGTMTAKSVKTSPVYESYMPSLGAVQNVANADIWSGFPIGQYAAPSAIDNVFAMFDGKRQAQNPALKAINAMASPVAALASPVASLFGGGGKASSVTENDGRPTYSYGDHVSLANGGAGVYAAPGLAMDEAGNLHGVSSSSASGGGGSSCYLTTAAVEGHEADDGPTLSALRWFRDAIMGGRHASEIVEYYRTAPHIVAWIDAHPKRDRIYRLIRRVLARCIRQMERFEFDKTRRLYKRMVRFLEARAND